MYSENKTLTPIWIAYVDGTRLDWKYDGALKRIDVYDQLDGIGTASLLFGIYPEDFEKDGAFSEGSEVSLCLGYKDDAEEVFSGEVTAICPRFEEYGVPQVEVRIESRFHRLKNCTRSRSFENKTPAQIIQGIISEHGLKSEVEDFGPRYNYTEQRNTTDYDYLMGFANKYGKSVYCQDRTIYVRTEVTPTDEDVVLEKGKTVIYARAKASIDGQLSVATCSGWDMMEVCAFTATVTMKDLPLRIGGECSWEDNSRGFDPNRSERLTSEEPADEDDAMALAQAVMLNRSLRFQRCEVKTQGNHRIKPGNRLTIKYIGEMFSGEYLVESVEHSLDVLNGFTTICRMKRNFCGTAARKGNASEIDRERADSQSASTQEEISVPELKVDQSKWIAQAGIPDASISHKEDYSTLRMGGRRLTSSEIFDYLKATVKYNGLMGKPYSTDDKNPYVCTTFVDEVLSLVNASKSDYLPGGQRVVNTVAKLTDLTESNGKNPKEGTYIFYYDYGDGTGHTGFVKFDSKGNAEILHNGSDGKGNKCVNLRTRDSRDFATWFSNSNAGKLYYKKLEIDIWID